MFGLAKAGCVQLLAISAILWGQYMIQGARLGSPHSDILRNLNTNKENISCLFRYRVCLFGAIFATLKHDKNPTHPNSIAFVTYLYVIVKHVLAMLQTPYLILFQLTQMHKPHTTADNSLW